MDIDELGLAVTCTTDSSCQLWLLILTQDLDSYWLREQYEKMVERTLVCPKLKAEAREIL